MTSSSLSLNHAQPMSLLEVDALEAGYDDALVLHGVSLGLTRTRSSR